MFKFKSLKKRLCPIGVDLGSNYLKMAQLGFDENHLYLHAAGCEARPEEVEHGSSEWQRWAAKTAGEMMAGINFKGKQLITAMPSDDVFIDQIRIPKSASGELDKRVFSKVKHKLPFNPDEAMVKYVTLKQADGNGEMDVLVMATEKGMLDRHLAIYEQAGLEIKGMSVWPLALTNTYVRFFGRRDTDAETITMLLSIGANHSNIVICRSSDLLFARVAPIGFTQINQEQMSERLVAEMDACYRYFESTLGAGQVQRLIFLSGRAVDKCICEKVAQFAQRMQIPAQIGDVLAAMETMPGCNIDINRRGSRLDWATVLGLSLTEV